MTKHYLRYTGSVALWIVITLVVSGCGTVVPPPSPSPSDGSVVQEVEPDDFFTGAQVVAIPSSLALTINGTLVGGDDVDVYNLGTFQAGQTLSASLSGVSAINPQTAQFGFFDQDQEVAILDDNAVTVSDQVVSFIVRKPGTYYLAVAQDDSPSAPPHDYSLQVTVAGGTVPTPPKQIVFINFNGASNLKIDGVVFDMVQPFWALNNGMDPQTVAVQTVAEIRADFIPYNVQLVTSYEASEPTEPHSTVYMSSSTDQDFYGLSDAVDWYNQDPTDNTVILAGLLNGNGLTQTQFVQALANVTVHEMGHLTGLAHTVDHTELMDQVTPLNLLDQPQTFHVAPLAEFPIGDQDSPQLLLSSLGLF